MNNDIKEFIRQCFSFPKEDDTNDDSHDGTFSWLELSHICSGEEHPIGGSGDSGGFLSGVSSSLVVSVSYHNGSEWDPNYLENSLGDPRDSVWDLILVQTQIFHYNWKQKREWTKFENIANAIT